MPPYTSPAVASRARMARARTAVGAQPARAPAAAAPAAAESTRTVTGQPSVSYAGWDPRVATGPAADMASMRGGVETNPNPQGTAVLRATTAAPRTRPNNAATQAAREALAAPYLGRSRGAQRYGVAGDPSRQFTNQQRERARETINNEDDEALRDMWWDEIERDQGRETAAADQYGRSTRDATRRLGALDDFTPQMQEEYDLGFLRDFDPSETRGYQPNALDGFDSRESRAVDLGRLRDAGRGTALRGVNTQQLRGFDAGGTISDYLERSGGAGGGDMGPISAGQGAFDVQSYVRTAAEGASGIAREMLRSQLTDVENQGAARGRLRTGFLDADKGTVIQRVGENLNNTIASRAVDAAQIQAGMASADARNVTDANIATARERGDTARSAQSLRSAEARDAARLGLDAVDAATGYDTDIASALDNLELDAADAYAGRSIDRAANIDGNALTAAEATDRLRLDRAQTIDDTRFRATDSFANRELQRRQGIDDGRYTARRDAADLGLRMRGQDQDFYTGALDRSGDRIASERDRVTNQQNLDRMIAEARRNGNWRLVSELLRGGTSIAASAFGGG